MDLRAHLRHAVVLLGQLRHHARLADGVGERLLAVDVLAQAQGRRRGGRVDVVGRGHHHGVDVLLLQQFSQVVVLPRLGEPVGRLGQVRVVHVAEGGDVHQLGVDRLVEVVLGLVGDADEADVELFVGGSGRGRSVALRRPRAAPGDPEAEARRRRGGALEEVTAVEAGGEGSRVDDGTGAGRSAHRRSSSVAEADAPGTVRHRAAARSVPRHPLDRTDDGPMRFRRCHGAGGRQVLSPASGPRSPRKRVGLSGSYRKRPARCCERREGSRR